MKNSLIGFLEIAAEVFVMLFQLLLFGSPVALGVMMMGSDELGRQTLVYYGGALAIVIVLSLVFYIALVISKAASIGARITIILVTLLIIATGYLALEKLIVSWS